MEELPEVAPTPPAPPVESLVLRGVFLLLVVLVQDLLGQAAPKLRVVSEIKTAGDCGGAERDQN